MTDERRKELESKLQASGLVIMRADDRDTLLLTLASTMKEARELRDRLQLLKARTERAETALEGIKTFGRHDAAVQHILRLAGVES